MACMPGRILRLSCRLHLTRRGDLIRLLLRVCTNDIQVDREVVRRVRVCIVVCFVLCWVPLFYPTTAPQGSGLLSIDVECVACRARVC